MSTEHHSDKENLNLKPACNTRQLLSLQKRVAITILKTDSFQLLSIGCGKFLQPDQWLALMKEVYMALKTTDVMQATKKRSLIALSIKDYA